MGFAKVENLKKKNHVLYAGKSFTFLIIQAKSLDSNKKIQLITCCYLQVHLSNDKISRCSKDLAANIHKSGNISPSINVA